MILLFWSVMARVREVTVSFLSFSYCGDWGSKPVKYSGLVTKYANKVLLGFPSSRLSELLSSFKLMVIFVPLTNLLVLCISLRESSICDFSSVPIREFSSLSVYTPLFNTIFLPVLRKIL